MGLGKSHDYNLRGTDENSGSTGVTDSSCLVYACLWTKEVPRATGQNTPNNRSVLS